VPTGNALRIVDVSDASGRDLDKLELGRVACSPQGGGSHMGPNLGATQAGEQTTTTVPRPSRCDVHAHLVAASDRTVAVAAMDGIWAAIVR
jgi:hypothetical protein